MTKEHIQKELEEQAREARTRFILSGPDVPERELVRHAVNYLVLNEASEREQRVDPHDSLEGLKTGDYSAIKDLLRKNVQALRATRRLGAEFTADGLSRQADRIPTRGKPINVDRVRAYQTRP